MPEQSPAKLVEHESVKAPRDALNDGRWFCTVLFYVIATHGLMMLRLMTNDHDWLHKTDASQYRVLSFAIVACAWLGFWRFDKWLTARGTSRWKVNAFLTIYVLLVLAAVLSLLLPTLN